MAIPKGLEFLKRLWNSANLSGQGLSQADWIEDFTSLSNEFEIEVIDAFDYFFQLLDEFLHRDKSQDIDPILVIAFATSGDLSYREKLLSQSLDSI